MGGLQKLGCVPAGLRARRSPERDSMLSALEVSLRSRRRCMKKYKAQIIQAIIVALVTAAALLIANRYFD